MSSEDVLEAEQFNVRPKRHLAHAVRVEVKLVFDDLGEVLPNEKEEVKTSVQEEAVPLCSIQNN